jgi:hypothetical protein
MRLIRAINGVRGKSSLIQVPELSLIPTVFGEGGTRVVEAKNQRTQ